MLSRSQALRSLLVASVTLVVMVFLLWQLDLNALQESLRHVRLKPLFFGLLMFLLGHLLRYCRYALIWRWQYGLSSLAVTGWHGVASYMLPMRLGELVLPTLAKRLGGQGFITALFSLIWLRLFDLLFVMIVAVVFLLLALFVHPEWLPQVWWPTLYEHALQWRSSLMLLLGVLLVFAVALAFWVLHRRLGLMDGRLNRWSIAMLTLLIWLPVLTMNTLLAQAVGVTLSVPLVVWLLIGTTFAYVIPVQGLAGLGGHQLVWYAVLIEASVSHNEALTLSVSTHVLTVFWVLILALISALLWWRCQSHRLP